MAENPEIQGNEGKIHKQSEMTNKEKYQCKHVYTMEMMANLQQRTVNATCIRQHKCNFLCCQECNMINKQIRRIYIHPPPIGFYH